MATIGGVHIETGLAVWHYPQRSLVENIRFFSAAGFTSLSSHGVVFLDSARNPQKRTELADAVRDTGIKLTVHHFLPSIRFSYTSERFQEDLSVFRRWQDDFELISILSFDAWMEDTRPEAWRYLSMALETFRSTETVIAAEDYGLTEAERTCLEHFRCEHNFGYLLDIGHLNIRLHDSGAAGFTAFRNCGEAAPLPYGDHSIAAFENALCGKQFPVPELHLHNNNGFADQHRLLEEGDIDMPGLAAMLKRTGFSGVVTIEAVPDWLGPNQSAAQNRAAEQEFWRILLSEFRVPAWTGTYDLARDQAVLDTFEYWKQLIK